MSQQKIALADSLATEQLGASLAPWLATRAGGVIYLMGALGAGKTTLVRALLRALGVEGAIRSPTYTLVEPYSVATVKVLHMDLYRLEEPDELYGLGVFDDPPQSCWWLVEWPEKGQGALPVADLRIELAREGPGRIAVLDGPPEALGRSI